MLGFLQTIIYAIASFNDFVYDNITRIISYIGYIGGYGFSVWKLCFNIVPVPLQIVGGICGGIMLVRLVVSLGRR